MNNFRHLSISVQAAADEIKTRRNTDETILKRIRRLTSVC